MLLWWKWLKSYLDLSDITPEELATKLTLAGIEVEGIFKLSEATNLVVGHVLEKTKHPEANKLSVCQVDLGDTTEQIVCGAPNVAKGQKVVVAKIGAHLPGGIKIKKAKLRGVESNGMICSLRELGIENKLIPQEFQNGIVVLAEDAPVGANALSYLGFDEPVFELSLTPNRSDCLSMYGLIYEIGAILNRPVKLDKQKPSFTVDKNFTVQIQSKDCTLYYAKKVKGVKIRRSPDWLQSALIACGVRPINNVVDITNYVMMELGQPLHAFDLNKLQASQIIVRNAHNGETIVTLDGIERELVDTDLLITDGMRPIALAGVMGGQNTEIDDNTTDVLLESAVFNPLAVRNTYKRLGLRSESSIRFEKQVDPERTLLALQRAAELLVELADGQIDDTLAYAETSKKQPVVIKLPLQKVNDVLGISLSKEIVSDTLYRLQFPYELEEETFTVSVPTRRNDITIPEDLIEEIIRIHGYEHLELTLPKMSTSGSLTHKQKQLRLIKQVLLSSGLTEVMTYSLTSTALNQYFIDKAYQPISLRNPMSEDRSVMRFSLLPHLLQVVSYNQARKWEDVFIFEVGNRYYFDGNNPKEELLLSGALSGEVVESQWQKAAFKVDFFYVKGILENIFERLGVLPKIKFVQNTTPQKDYHPGKTANILLDGEIIGVVGAVHPHTINEFDVTETYVFELNLEPLLQLEIETLGYNPISKFPIVQRDIAVVVDKELTSATLVSAVKEKGKGILKQVEVFDVYQGEHIEKTKKSVALSLTFEDKEKTLTDEEVNAVYDAIINHLEKNYNAVLRK
ncbi:MAG: phenylalanine--tRNA ligase subunit beta [Bacilli bacterium]|nr:phenylalanine--tRNA ligase subunit beta [Bacilli bacterium]